jgi:hypothetical protein
MDIKLDLLLKNPKLTNMKIEIFESPVSNNIVATFDNIKDLEEYAEKHNTSADCVAINDMILLGWDELYNSDFI